MKPKLRYKGFSVLSPNMILERLDEYIVRYYRDPQTDIWRTAKGLKIHKNSYLMKHLIKNWHKEVTELRISLRLPREPIITLYKNYPNQWTELGVDYKRRNQSEKRYFDVMATITPENTVAGSFNLIIFTA